MNNVELVGRLTRDAKAFDSKVTNRNNELMKNVVFTLAVDSDRLDKDGNRPATFINCALLGSDKLAAALTKGTLISLTGRLDTWTKKIDDNNYENHYMVRGTRMQFLSSKKDSSNAPADAAENTNVAPEQVDISDDDLPF